MNVNAMGAIVILITAVSCYATYIIATKLKLWILRLIPAFLSLVGAVICYFIFKNVSNVYDFSSNSYIVVFGLSFAIAFYASLLTIGVVYIKVRWVEVFKFKSKKKLH
jgi:zinc transporter ZupT